MEFRTLFRGCVIPGRGSPQPGLFLLRTPDELARDWEWMTGGQSPRPQLPAVDWASEVALELVLGWRPTTGYTAAIEQVAVVGRELEVTAVEDRPGGYTGDMVTWPVHIVALPTHDVPDDLRLIQRILAPRD